MELGDSGSEDFVRRLVLGFEALYNHMQDLTRRNQELEQQLGSARQEARHLTRTYGPLSQSATAEQSHALRRDVTDRQRREAGSIFGKGGAGSIPQDVHSESFVAISEGIEAWKALSDGKGHPNRTSQKIGSFAPVGAAGKGVETDRSRQTVLPSGHPPIGQSDATPGRCPFPFKANADQSQSPKAIDSTIQRPNSLPTPPHNQDHLFGADASSRRNSQNQSTSPPASISESISKCPIRLLDERSPEEIAEYFEMHKHEVPRSHEICVRRYQSNAQSIRQLDAKYGNLANMIQGLGAKHQPMLRSHDEEGSPIEMDARSARKIEKWTDDVNELPDSVDPQTSLDDDSDADGREGHFDRPLREIRVGESPSRPWGIQVPTSATAESIRDSDAVPTPKELGSSTTPVPSLDEPKPSKIQGMDRMVFNGPVILGYTPEQVAALVEKLGWQPQAR